MKIALENYLSRAKTLRWLWLLTFITLSNPNLFAQQTGGTITLAPGEIFNNLVSGDNTSAGYSTTYVLVCGGNVVSSTPPFTAPASPTPQVCIMYAVNHDASWAPAANGSAWVAPTAAECAQLISRQVQVQNCLPVCLDETLTAPAIANATLTGTYRLDYVLVCGSTVTANQATTDGGVGDPNFIAPGLPQTCSLYAVNYDNSTGVPAYSGSQNVLTVTGNTCYSLIDRCVSVNGLSDITINTTPATCLGPNTGSINIFSLPAFGTFTLSYIKNNGPTVTLNGQVANGTGNITIGNLGAGDYDITITDGGGCSVSDFVTIDPAIGCVCYTACAGGTFNAIVNSFNNVAPYTLDLVLVCTDGANAITTTTTANSNGTETIAVPSTAVSCNLFGVNHDGVVTYTGGAANTLTVNPGVGYTCYTSLERCVIVNPLPSFTTAPVSNTCPATTASLTSGVTYNGNGTVSYFENDGITAVADATSAPAGTYVVVVTEGSCSSSTTIVATITSCACTATYNVCDGSQIPPLTAPPAGTPANANIAVSSVNTLAPYKVDFVLVCSGTVVPAATITGTVVGTADALNGVAAANFNHTFNIGDDCVIYAVNYDGTGGATPNYGTDALGNLITTGVNCLEKVKACVQVNALPTASTVGGITNVSCNGGNNGAINLTASGTLPLAYEWDNDGVAPADATADAEDLNGLTAATYNVTVTDANGCTAVANGNITEPTALSASANAGTIACNGGTTTVIVSASGGTAPYTGEGTFTVSAGAYSFTVTDNNGCTAVANGNITEPTALSASANAGTIACNGGTTTVTVSASGGTAPYSGEGTFTVSAGAYSFTVTDNNGCTAVANGNITEPSVLTATTSVLSNYNGAAISCNGAADGSVTVTSLGGTAPYQYNWTSGSTTADANGLGEGTYTVTVTDNNGCQAISSIAITEPIQIDLSAVISSNYNGTDISCNGATDGSINLTASGGTGALGFLWSNGATTEDLSNVGAGIYTVTVQDVNGCNNTVSITLNEPIRVGITVNNVSNATCGSANGAIDVSASGGTGTLSFLWSNGATTEDIANIGAGTYNVTVTDANNCSTTTNITVTTPGGLTLALVGNVDNVTCNGDSDGEFTVAASGGTTPYSYNIGTGDQVVGTFGSLSAGNYTVTVTDGIGCSALLPITVTQPDLLQAGITITDATCNGANGGASIVGPVGGTAPYTYLWSNGSISISIGGVASGSYAVTITDANGCSITKLAKIETTVPPNSISAIPSCIGGLGVITVTAIATPSTDNLEYSLNGTNYQLNNVFTNLANNTYTIYVRDVQNQCTETLAGVVVNCNCPAPVASNNGPVCAGTALQLSVNANLPVGVTATYAWGGPGGSSTQQNPTIPNMTSAKAGTYTVTVTYSNGCIVTAATIVGVNAKPTITAATPSCVAGTGKITVTATGTGLTYSIGGVPQGNNVFNTVANGTYTVTVTNGTGCTATTNVTVNCSVCPIPVATNSGPVCVGTAVQLNVNANLPVGVTATYTWGGPAGSSTQQNPIIPNMTSAKVGSYCVTVTYSNGCVASACTSVALSPAPTASISGASSFCAGSSATLTATGGGTYAWSNGGNTASTNVTTAGTYTVTVTNASGCTKTATRTVTVNAAPVIAANVACGANGGTVTISGSATSFTLNGVTQSSNVFTGVGNGTYTVSASNTAGCVGTTSVTVNCNVCLAEVGDVTVNAVVCPGDPFVVTPDFNSPTAGYANYIIVANAAGVIVEVAPATSGVAQTLSTSTAGTYNIYAYTVQVPNGGPNAPAIGSNVSAIIGNCFDLSNPPYEVVLPGTPLLLIGYQNSDEGNNGGITPFYYNTDTVVIEGGVQPYNFDWDIVGYVRYDITYTATGAEIVIYYADDAQWNAIVTDSYGCSNDSLIFTNMQGSVGNTILDIDSYVVTPSSDYASANGIVTLNVSGGNQTGCAGGYTYEWAGPDTWNGVYGTSSGTPVAPNGEQYVLTGLQMGWYSVTVTDCSGNVTEGWYWVSQGTRGRTKTETGIMMNIQPNPFSDVTSVQFGTAASGNATVIAYTIDGKQVATLYNGEIKAGQTYQVPFKGSDLPSGMYLIQIVTNKGEIRTEKVMIAH